MEFGTPKFGKPGAAVRRRFATIDDGSRLQALSERLPTAGSWSDLFQEV